MGRMYGKGKGIASSAIPYKRTPPTWLKMKPEDVCDHICKLAKKGLTPSQIGVTLRDSFGVPQVKNVTGNHILRILKTNGLAPTLPEDLYYLIKKAVSIRKHLDKNRKDKDAKFRLILVCTKLSLLPGNKPHGPCRDFTMQVLYSKFRAAAPNYRPLLSLLNKRVEVNETYAATLEEIEGFFVHLRLRLLTPVSTQLQSIVHGELELSQLAPATRQASTYILEIAQLEKQCFEAYFELRHQQEALRTLLSKLADAFYQTMRPLVLACDSIDSLREIADCLQMDVLEPHRLQSDVCVLGAVYRLHKDVQEKLIYRVEMYIREEIKGYVLGSSDLDYPSILYGSGTDTPHQEAAMGQFQRGWYPTLPRTLSILAKIYRVLEMSTFQGLAQEAVDLCMRSLKEASEYLSRRSLPSCDASLQVFQPLVQMMDSQLFLVKHLLLLREQVAAFECELVVSEKYFNFANVWEALNLKLPDGILGILKPTVYHAEVDSKKDIESELKAACEALITNVTAHITQPLAAVNTKIGHFLASPGVDRSSLKDQGFMQPDELRDVIGAFMANVKAKVPFTAAHIRLYLSAAPGGQEDPPEASRSTSTSPILWKPVEMRLVDTWGRLEGLLEEQGTSLETLGFPRPEPLRELIASLFNAVMEEPWENVVQMVSQVPRRNFSAESTTLPAAASQASLGQPEDKAQAAEGFEAQEAPRDLAPEPEPPGALSSVSSGPSAAPAEGLAGTSPSELRV
ncbi:COG3 [Symbiodinium sp. KB8]|nr:COG3 [Symbiodinium sp. KB8]